MMNEWDYDHKMCLFDEVISDDAKFIFSIYCLHTIICLISGPYLYVLLNYYIIKMAYQNCYEDYAQWNKHATIQTQHTDLHGIL